MRCKQFQRMETFGEYSSDKLYFQLYDDQYECDGYPTVYYFMPLSRNRYGINHEDVTDLVQKWLSDMGYEWGSMSDQEKWELELFMRSL